MSGITLRSNEITMFEQMSTAVAERPIPIPLATDDEVASFVDRLLNDPKEDNSNETTLANIWKDNVPSIEFKLYNEYKAAKQYALDKTLAELKQAVEGFFHNLNTLQSRSGN